MGLRNRRNRNESARARGIEPTPGLFAGIKRRARYLRRAGTPSIKIKNPERYLHATARRLATVTS